MKHKLINAIEAIRLGNNKDAKQYFSEYISDKTAYILSENYDAGKNIYNIIKNNKKYSDKMDKIKSSGVDKPNYMGLVKIVAKDNGILLKDDDVDEVVARLNGTLRENYGDSDFEDEVYNHIMNVEEYYLEARRLKDDDVDHSKWEELVHKVAQENNIYPEGEDDVYDTVQHLMGDH